ncbi:Hypothetical protein MVR_LOCUS414 [uncultured virus]|nr:Hypothetical protein MVR_LOCUS414 [uncultured virus]
MQSLNKHILIRMALYLDVKSFYRSIITCKTTNAVWNHGPSLITICRELWSSLSSIGFDDVVGNFLSFLSNQNIIATYKWLYECLSIKIANPVMTSYQVTINYKPYYLVDYDIGYHQHPITLDHISGHVITDHQICIGDFKHVIRGSCTVLYPTSQGIMILTASKGKTYIEFRDGVDKMTRWY